MNDIPGTDIPDLSAVQRVHRGDAWNAGGLGVNIIPVNVITQHIVQHHAFIPAVFPNAPQLPAVLLIQIDIEKINGIVMDERAGSLGFCEKLRFAGGIIHPV